jgi:hypothetical protein
LIEVGRNALVALGAATALIAPASAIADTRHAFPDGGEQFPCGLTDRCSLEYALDQAGGDDEVIVEPGLHDLGSDYVETPIGGEVDVHGRHRDPARVTSTGSLTIWAFGNGRIADLVIENQHASGNAIFAGTGSFGTPLIERIRAFAVGSSPACRVTHTPGVVRDSLCVNTGGGPALDFSIFAGGPLSLTIPLVNVTAIADSTLSPLASAARFEAAGEAALTVRASNSIFRGGGAANDVTASASGSASVNVILESSNYEVPISGAGATITPAGVGTNQIADPLFVDPTALDYRQLATSPTINAGLSAPTIGQLGAFDFDHERRRFGSRPDIGADEFTGILDVKARKRQDGEQLKVKATCPLAKCRVKGKAEGYETDRAKIRAGKTKTLKLEREGTEPDSGKVKVKVRARDRFGGKETERARIKLR